MKNLFKSTLLAVLLLSISSAYAVTTGSRVVERVQMSDTGTAYFRPVGIGGWGGQGCPDASYAYIHNTAAAFDHIVSLAITSKLNGSKIRFYGTCNEQGTYLLIDYAILF